MHEFLQQIIFGLSLGSTYALIALAITLVFRGMDLINFAQGEIFMVGAFLGYVFYVDLAFPFILSLALSIVSAYFFGIGLERIFLRRLQYIQNPLALFLMTVALFMILRSTAQLIFGSSAYSFPSIFGELTVTFAGITIHSQYLVVVLVTLFAMALLYYLFARTSLGLSLRAVAQDKLTASMVGINVAKMNSITFGLCAVLGAIAGIIYAPLAIVSFDMGQIIMLKGFTAALLGGLGIIPGAVFGGMLLGIIEQMGTIYLSSAYKDLISFSILLLIILIKPNGLLGKKKIKKV